MSTQLKLIPVRLIKKKPEKQISVRSQFPTKTTQSSNIMKLSDPPQQSRESKSDLVESETKESKHTDRKPKKIPVWLLAIIFSILGAVLGRVFIPEAAAPTAQADSEQQTSPKPKAVETVAITRGTAQRQIKLLGSVEAGERASLSPQLDGTVQRVLVREGDRVTEGMTLAVLDDADSRLALAEAQARLAQERGNLNRLLVGTRPEIIAQREAELKAAKARENEAKDNLERVSGLTQDGALSQRASIEAQAEADAAMGERYRVEAQLSEAQAGATKEEIDAQRGLVAAAQAAVEQAQLGMQRTEIKAAFSGTVQSRSVDPGDYVEINDPVLTLVSDRTLDIFLEIPESLSGQVTPGMIVNLNARALPNWQQEAEITAVVPTANTASRRQLVRVSLDNPPTGLLPGMAISANLSMPVANADTFVVPRDALTRRGNEWLLFVVEKGVAKKVAVEMVADMGMEVAIASTDLQPDQEIVLRGGDGLKDNTPVRI